MSLPGQAFTGMTRRSYDRDSDGYSGVASLGLQFYYLKESCDNGIFKNRGKACESKTKKKDPEIVMRGGKPAAIILDIDEYRELLERVEDADDLKMLKQMRKRPLKLRKLEDVLKA